MYKMCIKPLEKISGFIAAALVDIDMGYVLERIGDDKIDLDIAADGNAEVLRAKRDVVASLVLDDEVEDILIILHKSYHLIRPLKSNPSLFIYLALTRELTNLGLARRELEDFEEGLLDLS